MKFSKPAAIVTFLSLIASVMAFVFALHQSWYFVGGMLLMAAVFDFFDGKIARWTKSQSDAGMYFDSLVDIISFGAMPAAIALILDQSILLIITAIIFLAAGVYRLARFQAERKKDFQGMPITMNGILVGILFFLPVNYKIIFPIYFIVSAALMVSTFKVKKL